jgi:hypothetical protein
MLHCAISQKAVIFIMWAGFWRFTIPICPFCLSFKSPSTGPLHYMFYTHRFPISCDTSKLCPLYEFSAPTILFGHVSSLHLSSCLNSADWLANFFLNSFHNSHPLYNNLTTILLWSTCLLIIPTIQRFKLSSMVISLKTYPGLYYANNAVLNLLVR